MDSFSVCCTDFLSFLAPDVNPVAFTTRDGATRYTDDFANIGNTHRLQRLALCIADIVERIALCHEEVAAPTLQFSYTAARETANLLAFFVIDVLPVFRFLDVRNLRVIMLFLNLLWDCRGWAGNKNLFALCLNCHCQHEHQDCKLFLHSFCCIFYS